MKSFELLERDGLARLGEFVTPHGKVRTPALLPVLHPDPARQTIPGREVKERFGFEMVISSAYITFRSPELAERARSEGIHRLLGFPGAVMTDSGAFQQHAYGHVEVGPEAILDFQEQIGTDVATVLDVFVEPHADRDAALAGVGTTAERARAARVRRAGYLAVPVQGGRFPELRESSARSASELGDLLAFGGVVPLLEQYRFAELARALLAARPGLAPEHPLHLFGAGHPLVFAFAALFGVDLFDSSSYHKFARRGALLFPHGTVALESVREPLCGCRLCGEVPLETLAARPAAERESHLARHNLYMCALEIARVRQAIHEGTLWELVERRAAAHPALVAGVRAAIRGAREFASAEPVARDSFRAVSSLSTLRPSVIRFLARLRQYQSGRGPYRLRPRVPLRPGALAGIPAEEPGGVARYWECPTPIGPVPLELLDLYPLGGWVGPEEFDREAERAGRPEEEDPDWAPDRSRDWTDAWTRRQLRALLEWQFGPDAVPLADRMQGERSRRTGRLHAAGPAGERWIIVGPGGVLGPTWKGAVELHKLLASPRARIVVDPDAVPFVAAGKSLFSKFVRGGDSSLVPGSPALLVTEDDRLLAVGRLLLAPYEMGRFERGVAVRVTAHARDEGSREPALEEEPPPFETGYG